MLYIEWTHDHYEGNIFVFAPSSVAIRFSINAQVSKHYSAITEWGGVYERLNKLFHILSRKGVVPFITRSSPENAVEGDVITAFLLPCNKLILKPESVMRVFQGYWRA